MKNLAKIVEEFSHTNALFHRGTICIVGISGGPDSTCLLDILYRLSKKYRLTLFVAHINYGLRAENSDEDEKFVRRLAQKYGVDVFVHHSKIFSKSPSEDRLRTIRYRFFEKVRAEVNADSIAVGHTKNDQAETVLLRIIRGTGLAGLAAMRPKTEFSMSDLAAKPNIDQGHIIRPLLGVERRDIREYLTKNGLSYRTDETNAEMRYTRNKIRGEVIPLLSRINPKVISSLATLAQIAGEDYTFLTEYTKRVERREVREENGTIVFSAKWFCSLSPSIQRIFLRNAILQIRGSLAKIQLKHITDVQKMIASEKPKTATTILVGLKFEKKGDTVIITKA